MLFRVTTRLRLAVIDWRLNTLADVPGGPSSGTFDHAVSLKMDRLEVQREALEESLR